MAQKDHPLFITITGVAGAGKTTLANIIGGVLRDRGMTVQIADDNGHTILQTPMMNAQAVLRQNTLINITTSDRPMTGVPL